MKLCFSTLACPQWDWDTVLSQAKDAGYEGIELRGLQNELDATLLAPFQPDSIDATLAQLKDAGLSLPCIDTSCVFLGDNVFDRAIQEGKAAIQLASRLGTPYIRVFGDNIPQGMSVDEAVGIVADGVGQLAAFAESNNVMVLQETHGSFTNSKLMLEIYKRVKSPAAGLLWDSGNTAAEAGEAPETTWENLKHLIRHVHVKDFVMKGGKAAYCLPGDGTMPNDRVVRLLRNGRYTGWLSFEWEKRWHPEIENPEISLPRYVTYMKKILAETR